jgi:hypothetical protein
MTRQEPPSSSCQQHLPPVGQGLAGVLAVVGVDHSLHGVAQGTEGAVRVAIRARVRAGLIGLAAGDQHAQVLGQGRTRAAAAARHLQVGLATVAATAATAAAQQATQAATAATAAAQQATEHATQAAAAAAATAALQRQVTHVSAAQQDAWRIHAPQRTKSMMSSGTLQQSWRCVGLESITLVAAQRSSEQA